MSVAMLEHRWGKERIGEMRARWPEPVPYMSIDADQSGAALYFAGRAGLRLDHTVQLRGAATDHQVASAFVARDCRVLLVEAKYTSRKRANRLTQFREAMRAGMMVGAVLQALRQRESALEALHVVWMAPASWQAHLRRGGKQAQRRDTKIMAKEHAQAALGLEYVPQGVADAYAMATTWEEQLDWR